MPRLLPARARKTKHHAGYKGLQQCSWVECGLGGFVFGQRWKPCQRGCGCLCTAGTHTINVLLGSNPESLDKSKKYFQFGKGMMSLPFITIFQ